jgi:hypothetical protein
MIKVFDNTISQNSRNSFASALQKETLLRLRLVTFEEALLILLVIKSIPTKFLEGCFAAKEVSQCPCPQPISRLIQQLLLLFKDGERTFLNHSPTLSLLKFFSSLSFV